MKKNNFDELDILIKDFYKNKKSADEYKKNADKKNIQIKSIMRENDLKDYTVDNFDVKYKIQERKNFNEDMLIKILNKLNLSYIIKQKEYVDMDGLENAIYNGIINVKDIEPCINIKEIEVLKVKPKEVINE